MHRPPIDTATAFRREIVRRLETHSDRTLLRILESRESTPAELTGRQILERAIELAHRHSQAKAGQVCLLLMPHSVELFLLHLGLVLTERLPAILAWPTNRINPEKYQRNLVHQLRNLPAAELLTLPQLSANLGSGLPYPARGIAIPRHEHFEKGFGVRLHLDPAPEASGTASGSPDEAVLLQFTGGTTGSQKCVVVTAQMLADQLDLLAECLGFRSEDTVVSWLPLYHDMGLIACLWFPLWHGASSVQFSASDWLLEPDLLFRVVERYHGTFCWLPNFAFSYMAAQRERMQGPYRLEGMRAYINCSEPVRLRSFQSFETVFRDWGVRGEQLQASYAMAENVFAVTQTPLANRPAQHSRSAIRQAARTQTQHAFDLAEDVYVSSGRPLPQMQIRIRDRNGVAASEATPGGIEILTGTLFRGYWGNEGFKTHDFTEDAWYATGDFGFTLEGELYVIGRTKDIVIVGGQNVFPEDVETLVNTLEGVYPGRVVAFGVSDEEQGTESLAVVAEARGDWSPERARALEREIKTLVLCSVGIAPRYVRVTPERWIVKSTAGKISRSETRSRFLAVQNGEHLLPAGENHG